MQVAGHWTDLRRVLGMPFLLSSFRFPLYRHFFVMFLNFDVCFAYRVSCLTVF